jgi:hypothetical protein
MLIRKLFKNTSKTKSVFSHLDDLIKGTSVGLTEFFINILKRKI